MNDESTEKSHIDVYGDERIASFDAPIPRWLRLTYILLPIIGAIWFYLYWNGSSGWLDRGYWHQLQQAAQTTFPHNNKE